MNRTIEHFKDFYGCTASVKRNRDQTYRLTVRSATGKLLYRKTYETYKGARIGMGKWSDCWERNV